MNKVLVICKGTGQSKSFERFMDDYTKKNNLPIEWMLRFTLFYKYNRN